LAAGLAKNGIEVREVDISSKKILRDIRSFKPDIVHFVLSPTTIGILSAKFLASINPGVKSIVSAVHPSLIDSRLLGLFKPDMVLAQSNRSARLLDKLGFDVKILTNGVDIERFRPVDEETKKNLRGFYGIGRDEFVVLHVGPMKRKRNLGVLAEIQKSGYAQVLVVGREGERIDNALVRRLEETGCIVWIRHFPNIENIYQISDFYVFPTLNEKACIETPLSVLEAMACNLPIISTRFGALTEMFSEGDGVHFLASNQGVVEVLGRAKISNEITATRDKVISYSWSEIVRKLEGIYDELLL
jgi:glycosyltransferase involved in cell wall biosynthesis